MKPQRIALVLAGLATVVGGVAAGASTPPTWKVAQIVALPAGGTSVPQGYLPALSCPSSGDCVAAGDYADASGAVSGLIANEVAGVWRTPNTISPPTNAASSPGVTPYGVSCSSSGNCVVVGSYQDQAKNTMGFVDSEVNGVWRRALPLALPAGAAASSQNAQIRAVACPSIGVCSAVGTYVDATGNATRGLVVNEVRGTWRRAVDVALPAGANVNPLVNLGQVACSSAGNCSAAGSYLDANNATHGLVVNETRGRWSAGVSLTPPVNANAYPLMSLSSIACAAGPPGNCTAIGTYENVGGSLQGLTAVETGSHWGRAIAIVMPPNASANPHVFLYGFDGISCPSLGNCATGGQYRDAAGRYQGFLVNEAGGVWQTAAELQLPNGASSVGKNGGVVAFSCTAAGTCSAGVAYLDASGSYQAMVVSETGGVWLPGTTIMLPGGANTVGVDGGVYGLVCTSPTKCTASGSYLDSSQSYQGFTASTN